MRIVYRQLPTFLVLGAGFAQGLSASESASAAFVPGESIRIAAAYEEGAFLNHAGTQTEMDLGRSSVRILAVWRVQTASGDKVLLEADCLEARFSIELPSVESRAEEAAFPAVWGHFSPWRGRLRVTLTPRGAVLETDPKTIVAAVEREDRKLPWQAAPTAISPDLLALRLRGVIERTVTEIFRDELTASRPAGGPAISIPLVNSSGRSEGAWEISFGPPASVGGRVGDSIAPDAPDASGTISYSRGAAVFVAPGGARAPHPVGLSRIRWTRQGSRRTEWSVQLRHPPLALLPWNRQKGFAPSRTLRASFVARRLSNDGSTEPQEVTPGGTSSEPLTFLDARSDIPPRTFVEGQVFLLEVSASEDLRSLRSAKGAGSWLQIAARAVARVTRGGEWPRLQATLIAGSLIAREEQGPGPPDLFRSGGDDPIRDLTGVRVSVEPGPDGVEVTVEEAGSLRPEDVRSLAFWIRSAAVGAFDRGRAAPGEVAPWPAIARVPIADPAGRPPGELTVEVDPNAPAELERSDLRGRPVETSSYPIRTRWRTAFPQDLAVQRSHDPSLCVTRDLERPLAAFTTWKLDEKIPAEAARNPRIEQHGIRVECRFAARQILGPYGTVPRAAEEPSPGSEGRAAADLPPPPMDPLPPPEFAASATGNDARRLAAFFDALPAGEGVIASALDAYEAVEEKGPGSWLAAAVHAECVIRLAPTVDDASLVALGERAGTPGPLPVRILAMRLVAHAALPAARRVETLRSLLVDPDPTVLRFAGRFLGGLRDPSSVAALLDGLRALEARPDADQPPGFELRLSLAQDLYRLLGEGAGAVSADAFASIWRRQGGRLPEDPLRPRAAGHRTVVRAGRAFVDARSPPIAFVLDASSSMESELPTVGLPLPPSPGEESPPTRLSMFEWARRELDAILGDLDERCRIACIVFNQRARTYARALRAVSPAVRRAVRSFLRGVETRRGTHIHAGLEKAFWFEDIRTVCLLSDGNPTLGAQPDEIDRDVFRWNYLRGAAVVVATFQFATSVPEGLCVTLPRRHFGWLRVLDLPQESPEAGASPAGEAGAATPSPLERALAEE